MATDVTHDPRWIIDNYLAGSHPAHTRATGEAMLANLQHQNQMSAQEAARLATIQGENTRAELARESTRQTARENELGRRQRNTEIAQARADSLKQRQVEDADREASRAAAMLPFIQSAYGKDIAGAQAATRQLLNLVAGRSGVQLPGQAPDPATEAVRKAATQMGKTTVQPAAGGTQAAATAAGGQTETTGTAPTFSPGAGLTEPTAPRNLVGTRWFGPTGGLQGGNNASMVKFYDDGTSETVPAGNIPGTEPAALPPVRRNVEGGQITPEFAKERGIPPGYDFNFSTGRMVPQGDLGTINGVPSAQAVAEGGVRLGINPVYSPAAMDILDKARAQQKDYLAAGGGKPTIPEGGATDLGTVPKPPGVGDLNTTEAGQAGLFSGQGGPGGVGAIVAPATTEPSQPTQVGAPPIKNTPFFAEGPVAPPINPFIGVGRAFEQQHELSDRLSGGGQVPPPQPPPIVKRPPPPPQPQDQGS